MAFQSKRRVIAGLFGLTLGAFAWAGTQDEAAPTSPQELPKVSAPFRWKANDRYVLRWNAHHRLQNTLYSLQRGEAEPEWATDLPSLETKEARTFQDWCQAVTSERPLRLRRRVEKGTLWGKLDFPVEGQPPLEVNMESPFTAPETTVQFTYIPEENDYGRYYDRNAGGEHRLQDMRLDLDLADWQPRGPVGTRWTLPVTALRPILSPGGEMHYATAERGKQILTRSLRMGFGGSWEPLLMSAQNPDGTASLQGTIEVQYERQEDSPVGPEAHLTFRFELRNEVDQKAVALSQRRRMEHLEGMRVQQALVGALAQGQGRVVWDVQRGRFKGLRLDGQATLTMNLAWTKGDEPLTREQTEYRGNFDVDAYLLDAQPGEEPEPWTTQPPAESQDADSE